MSAIKHTIKVLKESVESDSATTRTCLQSVCKILEMLAEDIDRAHNKIDAKDRSGSGSSSGSAVGGSLTSGSSGYPKSWTGTYMENKNEAN